MSEAYGISSHNTSIYNRGKVNAYNGTNTIDANEDYLKKKKHQSAPVNNIGAILSGSIPPNVCACGW